MTSPTADVSVRIAWPDDAAAIAGCQVAAWREAYATLLTPELLAALDAETFAEKWASSLAKPGDARNRVLVALERASVRGFAMTCPATDPDADPVADGEIAEFAIAAEHRGQGHGSRLIQACTDTMRADKFTRATWWIGASADALRTYVESTGWSPDGAYRELDLLGDGSATYKQVRLHTDLRGDSS